MPELPEVETTCRGIAPHVEGRKLSFIEVRNARLRWPVAATLNDDLRGQRLHSVTRRSKYLLLNFERGTLLIHLGMSGSLRMVDPAAPVGIHDHIDLIFEGGLVLRYNDPRRFGAFVLHQGDGLFEHPLLAHLGPEPLTEDFTADYLYAQTRDRKQPLKSFIMDAKIVVGVGNIYANEALFAAGLHPLHAAGKLTKPKVAKLVAEIKRILAHAIERGGTTLRDFVGGDGKPGYFAQELHVYGRGGKPCRRCTKPLTEKRLQNRTTVFCTACQK
ncbi:MAG: bifunctional DNA-formamidopyrimidine glycosylase/DNA-(apurinic or apyrimidinic site) lyase [Marinagarivorans sp.]|nr:bifunctional DNA-formamidopyrimidine glycosylase/DNA-(apurinic or apyrimidinic site) lyase [Marinagarivorans sp.]